MPLENPPPPWLPSAGVAAHNGEVLDAKQVFFRAPPPEIGEVLTAYSTLKTGQSPRLWLRILLASLFALPVLGIGAAIYSSSDPGSSDRDVATGFFTFAAIVFAIAFACLGFKRVCTYTGINGVARFRLKNSLTAKPIPDIFLFDQAVDLRTGSTRHYHNGIYTGTSYTYTWTDQAGKKVYKLSGRHSSKKGTPKGNNAFWYAAAAETAWTKHKLAWVQQQFDINGYVPFTYGGGNIVRIAPGFFEFVVKGQPNRITTEEIKHIKLHNGHFNIQHKDVKWFSGKGKYNFSYASVSNARLFLYTMEKLTGYRFS